MKTLIVKVGNSQGIPISKPLLEQIGIYAKVEIDVDGDHSNYACSNAIACGMKVSLCNNRR